VGKLRVWRESTTTSPSGLHLGHYKAFCARHQYSDIDDEDLTEDQVVEKHELNMMQQQLLELHLNLLNYALSRGYSYRRWRMIANTILLKDSDNVKIHRTRVIHIYEADFNLALGLKWRTAIFRSEFSRVLNDGQYGSRPRRNAIDPVMIEELQLEISRASRKTFAQTNYDATLCYDRIVPNLAMLASRFNRHTKREILYGSLSHGGANFRSLYVEQGIGQLKLFMRHWRLQTTTGKLFRVALSWFQLAVGVSYFHSRPTSRTSTTLKI
jgi:hypothetical protein